MIEVKRRNTELFSKELTPDSINELIKINYGLVRRVLNKFNLYKDPEAISRGYEALFKAVQTFDTTGTTSFSTYASVLIYNRLGTYVRLLHTEAMLPLLSYDEIAEKHVFIGSYTSDGQVLSDCGVSLIEASIAECLKGVKGIKLAVLDLWIASEFTRTQDDIAKQIGITQTYVSRIIGNFRADLKIKLEAKK